jgi:hypothetical protein
MRADPQPVRVLHNGRFSLPAGTYQLDVAWNGARSGEMLSLQVGRTGDPWQSWAVEARAGEHWGTEFSLPVDAGFVGLRGSSQLESVIQRIRIAPLSVVDAARRPREAAVIGASRSGPASVFYHDENAFPERTGFWVAGERRTRVTIERPAGAIPLVLRVHSGPIANRLQATTFGWSHTADLQPRTRQDITLGGAGRLVTLTVASDRVFVPRDREPGSTDTRPLGVWVEVVQ